MVSNWCDSVSGVLSLVFVLASCLTTCCNAFTEYGRADENVTLPVTTSLQGKLQGVPKYAYPPQQNSLRLQEYTLRRATGWRSEVGFKAPVAAGAWNGTFNASNDAEACPQMKHDETLMGNEDCLYLHVYTPEWGFADSLAFGPQFLLEEDLVVVVPNFRVGLLGFLTTGDEVAPGNNGLKDIVLALQWVQDNIQYFGGDPNQVTLAGHSSGAMSVSYLVATDVTKGLYQKVITHSGAAFSSEINVSVEVHVNHTIQLAEHFGCPTESSTLLISCLRDVDALELANTTSLYYVWRTSPTVIWGPVVETDIEGALLTDTIENLYAAGKIPNVPWLFLLAETEVYASSMVFYTDADLFDLFLENIDWILPHFVGYYWKSVDTVSAYTAALKSFYLNDLTADRRVLLDNVTDMVGDGLFNYPIYHSLQYQLAVSENPVLFAYFKYRGVLSKTYMHSGGWTNFTEATHGDEMIYIFESLNHENAPPGEDYDEDDFSMVETMVGIWASFATNGIPTAVHRNSTITWGPYTSSIKNYLRLGNATDVSFGTGYDLQKERMEFWDEMLSSTSGKPRNQIQLLTILLCSALWLAVF